MGTLVIIDMHESLLHSVKNRQECIDKIKSEIEISKSSNDGIILAENSFYGENTTIGQIRDLLAGYEKFVQFEHQSKYSGAEILSIISQKFFDKKMIKLCGLNLNGGIDGTKNEILYCTNYQVRVEVIEDGVIK